jgi:hypothetical protein
MSLWEGPANPACANCGRNGFHHGGVLGDDYGNTFCSINCGWSYFFRQEAHCRTCRQAPAAPLRREEESADTAPPAHPQVPVSEEDDGVPSLAPPRHESQKQPQAPQQEDGQDVGRVQSELASLHPKTRQQQRPANAVSTKSLSSTLAIPCGLAGYSIRSEALFNELDCSRIRSRARVSDTSKHGVQNITHADNVPVTARKPPRQAASLPSQKARFADNAMFDYHSFHMDFDH